MNKNEYIKAMDNVNVTSEMQQRILYKSLKSKNIKERFNMMSKRKICAIAVAATFVLGVTVFAASGIISHWYGSSSSKADYTALPTAEQCVKDIGYEPILIEKFDNGYTFLSGSVVENSLQDDNNNDLEKFKSPTFRYKNRDDTVIFSQNKYNSEMKNVGKVVFYKNGVDVYYNSYKNKVVPADYKLTDDDKKAEANGELVFSYGSDDVSVSVVSSVTWQFDNMHYNLMQVDGKLSADDLVQMVKEIMAK